MCQTVFTLHIYYLAFISGVGGDGGGVADNKGAKPVTAVQDCISTFVSVKLLDVFDKGPWCSMISKHGTSRHF